MTTQQLSAASAVRTAGGTTTAPRRRSVMALRAFARDRAALCAAIVLIVAILAAALAPLIAPYDPYTSDIAHRLAPPLSEGHLLGLDGQGRDILARLLYGGRYSLTVAIVPILVAFPIALAIGLFAGASRSRVGNAMMRALDAIFAFPIVLLALALTAVLGRGLGNMMIAIGVTVLPYMARVAYNATVQEAGKEYVEAARAAGSSRLQILTRELMPNVLSPLTVYATSNMGLMIVAAAGLSFLGVGIIPPTPDWGVMTADGTPVLLIGHPHVATIPGLAILIIALSFNLIGDGLRDALDPRKQTK